MSGRGGDSRGGRGRGRTGRGQPSPSFPGGGTGHGPSGRGRTGRGQPSPSFPGGGTGHGPSGRGRTGRGQQSPSFPGGGIRRGPSGLLPEVVVPTQARPSAPSTSEAPACSPRSLTGEVAKKLTLEPEAALMAPSIPPSSSEANRLPLRPELGKVGKPCQVRANHFLVAVADKDLHHYDVSITPEVTSKKVNREIMTQLVNKYRESHLGGRLPAYDGKKSLYTAGAMPFKSKEFSVMLVDEGRMSSSRKEREFKVEIKFAVKRDLHHLQEFLHRRHLEAPQATIQVLDVVLRAKPSKNYTEVRESFFSPLLGGKGDLGNGIEYWKGYYQSLRPTQMGLSLNVDVAARSFYEPILVTDFVAKYFKHTNLSGPLSEHDHDKVKTALKGVRVKLTHLEYAKTCMISSISSVPINQLTFTLDDEKTNVSVIQYFHDKYKYGIKYIYLPAIQSGSEAKPVYLPMELCRIVEGQRYTKKLNNQQVRALLKATCERPNIRENNIIEKVRVNTFSRDELVNREFGIKVKEELAVVQARVLPAPMLKYHDSGRERNVNPGFGSWNMINKKMVNGGKVVFWTCVNFSLEYRNIAERFCMELVNICNSKGMEFSPTASIPIRSSPPNKIEKTLIDIHDESLSRNSPLQLLIIILPDRTGSYGKIKRICETELGIVSQCCQPKQASGPNNQYFENLALKINVKVGGRNTVLTDAILKRIPLVTDRPTIIFGADVTHQQSRDDSSPSIAAVVASMDWPEVTKYRGIVSAQKGKMEIIQDLYNQKGVIPGGMVRELLIAFYKSTNRKPSRIIFYRDGVSEGQFNQVLLDEVAAIRKACGSLEEGYLPPVTFIVVQKRHHTRLFPTDSKLTDKSGNIQAGTVVDTSICHPTQFDFYLNSHAGVKGTSRPAHYHVLFDENNFSSDNLQVLTNNLCYTYARCTKSLSIVPPAHYAHLAAFRARYYIEDEISDGGSGATIQRQDGENVLPLPNIKENVKNVMFYC